MGKRWAAQISGRTCGALSGNLCKQDQENQAEAPFPSSVPNGDTIQTSTAIPSHTCIAQVTEHGEHWPPNVSKLTLPIRGQILFQTQQTQHRRKILDS